MTQPSLSESAVEQAALGWLDDMGWTVAHGRDVAPDTPNGERGDYGEVVLEERLRSALTRLNPDIPSDAVDDAQRRLVRPAGATLEARNHALHRMLVAGVTVEYSDGDGRVRGGQVRVLDFEEPNSNDWLAVNQFTVVENRHERRPDIVLFINGLPLAVIELKNPADENATIHTAFKQLQTYKAEIPSLFAFNAALIVSDGAGGAHRHADGRLGVVQALAHDRGRDSGRPEPAATPGAARRRLRSSAGCWPWSATSSCSRTTAAARWSRRWPGTTSSTRCRRDAARSSVAAGRGDRMPAGRRPFRVAAASRAAPAATGGIGVVWHTQGSGKSLTMAFYAGGIVREPAMANPTVVVLTDRNDLDDQLFTTFSRCADLLGLPPVQAESRADLRAKLAVESGGVVFTTIQKFFPEEKGDRHPLLSDRRNIVVIADEAHRSQYDFIDGYARHMRDALPNASFIGFTGTPIELADASTRAVFGDHISVYDIQRAVDDEATVPIYYESRLARAGPRRDRATAQIDAGFEEVTEGEEADRREKLKTKWAQLEAVVGAEQARRAHRPRHRGALREPHGRDGRQGDGGLHEPADLHRPLPRAGAPAPGMARRRRHPRGAEGRDDGSGIRPARLAGAHRQQGPPRGAGEAVPRSGRPAPYGARARHVADRLRRPEPAHDVRGQADAGPRADAGHRAGQPGVPGQAGRTGRRLPRDWPTS